MSIQVPSDPERKWRLAPEELVRAFTATVQSLPGVELRRMFGYPCAFANGQMFAGHSATGASFRAGTARLCGL